MQTVPDQSPSPDQAPLGEQPAPNLFATIDAADEDAIARQLHAAIVLGAALTNSDPTAERLRGTRPLMRDAAELLVELTLVTQSFQSQATALENPAHPLLAGLLEILHDSSATAALLLWRALEAHPRCSYMLDGGRDDATRVACGVIRGSDELLGTPARAPLTIARSAAVELFGALGADPDDQLMVPAHLSAALGYVLALNLLADALWQRTFETP